MNNKPKVKTNSLRSLVLATLVFVLALSGGGLAFTLAAFGYGENPQSFVSKSYEYSWTDESETEHNESVTFDCYPIASGYSGTNPGVAVAWHDEAVDPLRHDTPDHLEIPSTLKDAENNTYDVAAIYQGGFRYCDFETISMPNNIQEIGAEAFAYCMSLTEFALPYSCHEISPSMLLDCRNLETFSFRASNGAKTVANSVVTKVGDHAFNNCVKLKGFTCPTSLIYIGDSAFQNCKKITTIFLPKTTYGTPSDVPVAERIHVGNYAFSECDSLTMFFFDVNMWSFGAYCFAKCNLQKLSLYYTGSDTDFEDPSKMGKWSRSETEHYDGIDSHWRDHYTALGNTELFSFVGGRGKFDYDRSDNYPGLYFTIDNDIRDLMLDQSILQTASNSWQAKIFRVLGNSSLSGTTNYQIDQNTAPAFVNEQGTTYKYATIIQFTPPEASDFPEGEENPYYLNGRLRIPATVKADDGYTYPVRVIDSNVFKDLGEKLTDVVFGEHLIQIRHHAFLGCDNIKTLDFSNCSELLEVSYEIFHSLDSNLSQYNTQNTKLTTLELPNCLKYIGASAFLGFTKVTSFHLSNHTVFIGQSAFQDLGAGIAGLGGVDMVLPNTLRDGPVDQASPAYGFKIYRYTANSIWDECIQKEAFKNAKCLHSVKMEPIPTDSALWKKVANNPTSANPTPKDHNTLKPVRMGIQINAFQDCTSLVRFEANKLLYVIGKEAFKGCTNLKEMFLTTFGSKVTNVNDSCAWGFNGSSIAANGESTIFGTSSVFTDLVIYVDDPAGPPRGNKTQANKTKWNAVSATYPNEFSTSTVALVPSYDGVVRDEVKYYDLSSSAAETPYLDSTDFSSPSVAFIKKTGNYTITRCYCGTGDIATVDMSKFQEESSIKTIGSGAFGQMDGNLPGRTIYLPSALTTIADRAFYRQSAEGTNSRGVQIVTYKNGGDPVPIADKDSYCVLPSSVTSVGRLAFYNNCFKAIKILGDLTYLGNTAFGVFPYDGNCRNDVSSIALGTTENTFSPSAANNGGLYYKASDHETLIYQPGSHNNNTTLNIDDGTRAVGARACANTTYTTVSFPNSVTTIYGGAFAHCAKLTSVTFGNNPGIKYIGAKAWTSEYGGRDTEVWSGDTCNAATTMNDTPGSTDIAFADYNRAFYKSGLTDFDFTKLNGSLVKIGYGAFEECGSLANMVGTQKYTYYKWTGTSSTSGNTDTLPAPEKSEESNQILDLSGCRNLRAIGYKAFKNCTSIKYIHLPNNYDPGNKALYLGSGEPESGRTIDQGKDESVFNGLTAKVFVGEKSVTANRAHVTENESRYPQNTFSSNIKGLFYAEGLGDLWSKGEASYWYQLPPDDNGTKRFVWFDKKANAISFFNSAYFASL